MSVGSNALAGVTNHYVGEWRDLSPELRAAYANFENFITLKVREHFGFDRPDLVKAIVDIATNNARSTVYEEAFEAAEELLEAIF